MGTQALTRLSGMMPSFFDDFFKPWDDWFGDSGYYGRTFKMPAVNITENDAEYLVSLAAPGMKKDHIDAATPGFKFGAGALQFFFRH